MGPFNQWPTGSGFEHFYGFVGGEANQYYPGLYEGTSAVEPPKTPEEGYTLTEDLADRAITWVRQQKVLMPDKPFMIYFAPGATHAPHHVPKEWSDKYKGKFDGGWDKLREETLAQQKKLGVVPNDAALTVRHAEIPSWDEMPANLKPVLARQMELYAGFLEQADHHVGRLVDTLSDLGILDDTLIYYIIGDNGASAEGTINGCFNEMTTLNGMPGIETPEFLLSKIDDFGTPKAYNHYAVGWAHALCAPYQWTKQVASHWGGTRNGMILHWPSGVKAKGEIRSQFHHVIDVAKTILDVTGLPEPTFVCAPFAKMAPRVIITQGGEAGGWTLYCHEGKLKYCYNFFGIDYFFAEAEKPIPAGKHQVRMEFKYDGGGLAKGGDVTLYYDGEAVGKGRVERSQPMGYSADEACDVGSDSGSPASPDYGPSGNAFTGAIEWVQIDLGDDDHNHLITPEERFKIAMARQ